jgi:hypothetical protein
MVKNSLGGNVVSGGGGNWITYTCSWSAPSGTWVILSSNSPANNTTSWTYAGTWTWGEVSTLSACSWKCNNVWYERNGVTNTCKIDSYTVLLLHWDWTSWSTTFTDNEATPKSITPSGNTQISTIQSEYGGASIYFDGNGDYLTIPAGSDFNFWNGDFTIDLWFYAVNNGLNTWEKLIGQRATYYSFASWYVWFHNANGTSPYMWALFSSDWSSWIGGGTYYPDPATFYNKWHHVAVVRYGTLFSLYVDGNSTGSFTSSLSLYSSPTNVSVGACTNGEMPRLGYIDEIRVSKGIARWTANFTPPSAPY